MEVGLVIIGDEILSGKRQDRHLTKSIEILSERGLKVGWVNYLPDDPDRLVRTFKSTFAAKDIVFSFGGIGATPDDHTRKAVADAAGVELQLNEDAKREIEQQFGDDSYPHRIKMGFFPEGSRAIPNQYNRIPGFSLNDHHFLPGFPSMAWTMMAWVLDNDYPHLHKTEVDIEKSILIIDAPESELIPVMDECLERFSRSKVFSLPTLTADRQRKVELGVKGPGDEVNAAFRYIQTSVTELGYQWTEVDSR